MNIWTKTNENKQIIAYSTEPQEGYTIKTITTIDAASLAQYYSLMWAEDGEGGLVHADNLPLTDYQNDINKSKDEIESAKQDIANSVLNAEKTVTNMQQTIVKLQNATMVANQKIQQMQNMLMKMQQANVTNQVTPSSASNQPTNNADSNTTVTAK